MKRALLILLLTILFVPALTAQTQDHRFRILALPAVGIGTDGGLSYGLRAGLVTPSRHGGYIQFKSDFNFTAASGTCDENGMIPGNAVKPWYTGKEQTQRLSLTAGYLYQFKPWLAFFAGAGYGKRALLWETADERQLKVTPSSFQSVEAEAGCIFSWDMFAFSVGIETCRFAYTEFTLGLGFVF